MLLAQTGMSSSQSYPQEEDKTDDMVIHGQQLEDEAKDSEDSHDGTSP
jgi:hypothetical protein